MKCVDIQTVLIMYTGVGACSITIEENIAQLCLLLQKVFCAFRPRKVFKTICVHNL